jgi:hypothetical protein
MARKPTKAAAKLEEIRTQFSKALKNNPDAKIQQVGNRKKYHVIRRPWDDESVAFLLPEDKPAELKALASALNQILMPPRLSAIYHLDRKELEVLFTARTLSDELKVLSTRKFSFHFRGKDLRCEFATSSDRLLLLAKHALYPQNSETGFRNLQSFTQYLELEGNATNSAKLLLETQFAEPLCFFIRGIDWHDEETLEVIRHISFYLNYYDSKSPYVIIHPPTDKAAINPKVRYIHGAFPDKISSRELNPILLSFWYAALDAEPEKKFLYYYRIIEFVASNYLKNEKLGQVRRILSMPDLASRIELAVDDLVGLIREEKPDTVNRFKAVVLELADKKALWQEICENSQAFTKPIKFEGGFELPNLLEDVSDISKLSTGVLLSLAGFLRDIRHALSHGGEAQAGRLILPTARNLKMLRPWVHVIQTIAGQVVLFEHHT